MENYRPDFSSERVITSTTPQLYKNNLREKRKNWSQVPDECLAPRQTGRPTVGRNITLTLILKKKFSVVVEDKMCTPRIMQAAVHQSSVLPPTLFNMYIDDTPKLLMNI
jgi:hypothetical protein